MDPTRKSQLHQLALGQAMQAAARDYGKELKAAEAAAKAGPTYAQVDVDDLLDDPELERLHAERLAAIQRQAEKRAVMQQKGHGSYEEISEGDFLETVTKGEKVVCHFFHRDFERCRIMDKHLGLLAKKHFGTRFIKLSAPDAPFFVEKLQVRLLPCVVAFVNGVAADRIVGFDQLGATDDFPTEQVEKKLLKAGVIEPPPQQRDDSDDEGAALRLRTVRHGMHRQRRTESDEDSDFD
ncbi:thioredoxin domain-containing PLP3B-like [Micractinium conductrix]|uniref:Thioredoxin domain-containing PLP3B-like n=1 Tax=Micractinium conductrix TaxID=554055 RepID=A0A2P6V3F2_9CHLO|nr:thioredoxin domain-containing PLP3B-like [Micractinium conductrix]|eukprot:PSC68608.1 thioredoxin domain-containing PLP3B-like [Micractinium conductrix]